MGPTLGNTEANTTLIASMSTAGMGAAFVLTGATDAAAFVVYMEQILGPTLTPGKVVGLDKLECAQGPARPGGARSAGV